MGGPPDETAGNDGARPGAIPERRSRGEDNVCTVREYNNDDDDDGDGSARPTVTPRPAAKRVRGRCHVSPGGAPALPFSRSVRGLPSRARPVRDSAR